MLCQYSSLLHRYERQQQAVLRYVVTGKKDTVYYINLMSSYATLKVILDDFLKTLEAEEDAPAMSGAQWALGKKHLFLR